MNIPRFNRNASWCISGLARNFRTYTRHREQVCTANNKQAYVHRRFSFVNEQRRKEKRMKRDSGYFARKRGRFTEIQAEQTGTFERKREEKSVSYLPVSLESELYFVIISTLSRSLLAFPLISFSTKAETETLKKKHVPRTCFETQELLMCSRFLIGYDRIVISLFLSTAISTKLNLFAKTTSTFLTYK